MALPQLAELAQQELALVRFPQKHAHQKRQQRELAQDLLRGLPEEVPHPKGEYEPKEVVGRHQIFSNN